MLVSGLNDSSLRHSFRLQITHLQFRRGHHWSPRPPTLLPGCLATQKQKYIEFSATLTLLLYCMYSVFVLKSALLIRSHSVELISKRN